MNYPICFDIETRSKSKEEIMASLPLWTIEDAMERLPKNIKVKATVDAWIENDQLNYGKDVLEKAALSPETGDLAVVGIWGDGHVVQHYVGSKDVNSEKDLVAFAIGALGQGYASFVLGWNLLGFDVPFVVKKAWMLGVPVPRSTFNPMSRYPVPDRIVDAMKSWQCGNFKAPFTSLNNAMKSVGLPGKPDGKEFGKLWSEDRVKALEYQRDELTGMAELSRRIGLL